MIKVNEYKLTGNYIYSKPQISFSMDLEVIDNDKVLALTKHETGSALKEILLYGTLEKNGVGKILKLCEDFEKPSLSSLNYVFKLSNNLNKVISENVFLFNMNEDYTEYVNMLFRNHLTEEIICGKEELLQMTSSINAKIECTEILGYIGPNMGFKKYK